MTVQKLSNSKEVTQVFPQKSQIPLEGLYLGQRLAELSAKIGRALVITNFITDKNGVIAKTDEHHHFQVPPELRNAPDWQLFQELMTQADVILIGSSYFKRLAASGSQVEGILFQFEPGSKFEKLGEWRLRAGYKKRSPDLAVLTRGLDFKLPDQLLASRRKIVIFTTYDLANSNKARALSDSGIAVIGCGSAGVSADQMIDTLSQNLSYRVMMSAAGPGVLELLLEAKRLDLLYLTEVQRAIPFDDPSTVVTLLPDGKKVNDLTEFSATHQHFQENVTAADGSLISQTFQRYDSKDIPANRSSLT